MRYLYSAPADEFPDDSISRNDAKIGGLLLFYAHDGFQQRFDSFVTYARVQEACVLLKVLRSWQQPSWAHKKWTQRRKIEGEATVDSMVGQAAQRDDAEKLARTHVMPVKDSQQRAVVAMVRV